MDLPILRGWLRSRPATRFRQWVKVMADMPDAWAWIVLLVLAANTLAYIVIFASPLIQSDSWYFLDVFLRKALDGNLHFGDFFVQRGGMDHALPLRKLILLVDMKYFHLDFRYEAIAGWMAAVAMMLVLRRIVLWHEPAGQYFKGMRVWIWAAMGLVIFSMNSNIVWGWPLLTSSFTSHVLMFATLLAIWRWMALGRPLGLILCALAFDLAADDTAMLVNIASVIALGVVAWRDPSTRKRALYAVGLLLACLVVVRIVYALAFTPPHPHRMATGVRLDHLWDYFVAGGWWQWIVVPLASSVAQIATLKAYLGDRVEAMQVVIGLALLIAHLAFWWRVLRKRTPITAPGFAAIVVMLTFYAFLAGIIYARVTTYGNAYINQPRYVLLFSFNLIALLLACADVSWQSTIARRIVRPLLMAVVASFALWQLRVSVLTWHTGPYKKIYQEKMAGQIGQLARDPQHVPGHCLPHLVICRYTPARRADLLGLLESHQLNLFSPDFQRANRLRPGPPRDH